MTINARKHPFASWLATMLMCFAASFLGNFLIGEPILTPFKNHDNILLASIVWYLMNYAPFDIVYYLARLLPFKLVICLLKEVQRARKIQEGVAIAYKLYPNAYLVCIIIGVVKGAGYNEMRILERLVRGVWLPASNEFLKPTFTTKASIGVSLFFLLEKMGRIALPHSQIFLGAVAFLTYFRLSSLVLGIHDPFVPFENLFCAVFMGGLVDAVRRAVDHRRPPTANGTCEDSTSHADCTSGAGDGGTGNQTKAKDKKTD